MYEKQFQFRTRPFCSVPAAECYFPASSIDAALESVKLCIDRASGPAIILGQSGWGKSLLLCVLQREFQARFRVVHIHSCTRMSRRIDLLQNILYELGQPYRGMSEGELRLALIDYLKPSSQCQNGILLLIDDAYNLPYRLLDELRMLTNFVRDGQPRARLVLAGTMAFEEKLNHPHLESFVQRITTRCYLQNLRRDEVDAYIRHQVLRANSPNPDVFQPSAISAVAQLCDGNPRIINQICDQALILAASCGEMCVTGEHIAEAFSDIQGLPANLWLGGLEPSKASTPTADAPPSNIIEFGQLAGEPTEATAEISSDTDDGSPGYDLPLEIADPSESIDEFSELVDSLVELEAGHAVREMPSASLAENDDEPEVERPRTVDPFSIPYQEEFTVLDKVAQLAARDNFLATQTSEDDIARLEIHLQRLMAERKPVICPPETAAERETSPLPSAEELDLTVATDISTQDADTDRLWRQDEPSVEYPIVDFQAYQIENDTAISPPKNEQIDDDRDMLWVAPPSSSKNNIPAYRPSEHGSISVTRGHAVRVDYQQLFHQLRGETTRAEPIQRK